MINRQLNVKYFEINNFISLSSISSINELNFWENYFNKNFKKNKKKFSINNLIPAAGSGKRHKEFKVAKPFIEISKKTNGSPCSFSSTCF